MTEKELLRDKSDPANSINVDLKKAGKLAHEMEETLERIRDIQNQNVILEHVNIDVKERSIFRTILHIVIAFTVAFFIFERIEHNKIDDKLYDFNERLVRLENIEKANIQLSEKLLTELREIKNKIKG